MIRNAAHDGRTLRRLPVAYGVLWGMVVAVAGMLLTAVWMHVRTLADASVVTLAYGIHCLAVVVGAILASRAAGERGWYHGGLTGLIYAVIMWALNLILYHTFTVSPGGLFRILLMAVIGAFAGIIGVNTVRD